ncbi:hypothetical protein GGI21_002441, partial [Coemansia aciculifera]
MFNDDEIDPHRMPSPQHEQEQDSDGVRNSLYADDIINPFANNAAAPWGATVSQAEDASPASSDVDEDDNGVSDQQRERSHVSRSAGDSATSAKAPRPLLSFTVGQMVDRSKR